MTSIIRVGQSKFVTVQIDEDSSERIMNCIQTLSELGSQPVVHETFLEDTRKAFTKMLTAQEVRIISHCPLLSSMNNHLSLIETCCGEERVGEEEGSGHSSGRSPFIPSVCEESCR